MNFIGNNEFMQQEDMPQRHMFKDFIISNYNFRRITTSSLLRKSKVSWTFAIQLMAYLKIIYIYIFISIYVKINIIFSALY